LHLVGSLANSAVSMCGLVIVAAPVVILPPKLFHYVY